MSKSPFNPRAFFESLGDALDDAWRERNYDERVFPELAVEALTREPPSGHLDAEAFLRWAITTRALPPQQDLRTDFGEPPVTVYRGPRFYIDVLFWLDGTTSIHEHAFSGAFHVLQGSSLHSAQRFEVRREVTQQFELGDLTLEHAELLERGATRPIRSRDLIHSLFHLDRPSVSVVVRTYQEPRALPQRKFCRPHVAIDTNFEEPRLTRRLQMLGALAKVKQGAYLGACAELLQSLDLTATFLVLGQANLLIGQTRALGLLLAEARTRHGPDVDLLARVLEEERKQLALVLQRRRVKDADERFFLALLMNLPSREPILRFVHARWPAEDPVEKSLALLARVATPVVDPGALALTTVELGSHGAAYLAARLRGTPEDRAVSELAALGGFPDSERERLVQLDLQLRTTHAYSALFAG